MPPSAGRPSKNVPTPPTLLAEPDPVEAVPAELAGVIWATCGVAVVEDAAGAAAAAEGWATAWLVPCAGAALELVAPVEADLDAAGALAAAAVGVAVAGVPCVWEDAAVALTPEAVPVPVGGCAAEVVCTPTVGGVFKLIGRLMPDGGFEAIPPVGADDGPPATANPRAPTPAWGRDEPP